MIETALHFPDKIRAPDNGACDDIRVPVKVFRGAMERKIEPVLQGTKVDRTSKGVVDNRENPVSLGEFDDCPVICNLNKRICHSLDIDCFGVGSYFLLP